MSERVDFEHRDVPPSLLAKLAAGVAAFVLAVPLVMPLIYPQARQPRSSRVPDIAAGAAALEVNPRARLAQFEKADTAALDRYGWIDRDHGFVQIPIARAMELLARRGLPGWPAESSGKDQLQDGFRH
jgi:hypothetical protein